MPDALKNYLATNFPRPELVTLVDSDNEAFVPDNLLRWLLRCAYECDVYRREAKLDTASVLSDVLQTLISTGHSACALIPLFWPTTSDFGLGATDTKNRASFDTDPVIISSAAVEDIHELTRTAVDRRVAQRNTIPPRNLFSSDTIRSHWDEIGPTVRLHQHICPKGKAVPKPIVEFHPLTTSGKTDEQIIQEFMSCYSPFFIGALGLPALYVESQQVSNEEKHYWIFKDLDPRYVVTQFPVLLQPVRANDWTAYLSSATLRPRLTILGPRLALAATVGSINRPQQVDIDTQAQETIQEAVLRFGKQNEPAIRTKVAQVLTKAQTTQAWFNRQLDLNRRYPDPELSAPTVPFSEPEESCFTDVMLANLKLLGFGDFI